MPQIVLISVVVLLTQLIREGQLGEVNAFHARWDRFRPTVVDRWRERNEPGSGVLYDLGSHLVDQALGLFGRPDWLQADVFTQRPGGNAADGFKILMGKGRLRICLGASSIAAKGDWRYRVHGSRASFCKSGLDPQEDQSRSGIKPDTAVFGIEPPVQRGQLVTAADGTVQVIESQRGRWLTFKACATALSVTTPPDEAISVIEIIETALCSSTEGRRIRL